MSRQLRTLGHATLLVLEDGVPLVATDPWLIGSTYWRRYWLEKYPSPGEVDLVRERIHIRLDNWARFTERGASLVACTFQGALSLTLHLQVAEAVPERVTGTGRKAISL